LAVSGVKTLPPSEHAVSPPLHLLVALC